MIESLPDKNAARASGPVIEIDGVTHCFSDVVAVNRVDLKIEPGSVFALLGRNGSGKSTLVKLILGLMKPTHGECRVFGQVCTDLSPKTRSMIGYLPEGHPAYAWMRVKDYERYRMRMFRHWDHDLFELILEHFRIAPNQRVGGLSRGQRGGLTLALTLAPDPPLLIFDDPALGLDPVARRSLLESMVYLARRKDRTILFCSHYLDDVERIADRVAVIDRGQLRANCPIDQFVSRIVRVRLNGASLPEGQSMQIPGLLHHRNEGGVRALVLVSAGAEGQLDKAQCQAIDRLEVSSWEAQPMGLSEAMTAYLDDRGAKPNFFERIARLAEVG